MYLLLEIIDDFTRRKDSQIVKNSSFVSIYTIRRIFNLGNVNNCGIVVLYRIHKGIKNEN
tara:strand:- start:375 stop:554 length:180 start_codon:yes stop_codon:yes gene_type:complete